MRTPRSRRPSRPRYGSSPRERRGRRRRSDPWKKRKPGFSWSVRRRLPAPTRKLRGVRPRPLPRLWRRPGGTSSARRTREGLAWTPFEGSSKGTLPRGRRLTWTLRTLGAAWAADTPPMTNARARGRPRKGRGSQPRSTPTTPTLSLHLAMGIDKTAGIAESARVARWEWPEPALEEAMAPLRAQMERVYHLPTAGRESTLCRPSPRSGFRWETRTPTTT